jgi:cell division protein FtsB|tara:strand:- start:31 stop:261 length:231 start_codon:yes stop_codon:yes gene_type:complete
MSKYLKVESDTSLIRDVDSGAIVNTNKSEYDKFMELSKRKYQEKQEMKNLKDDVEGMKSDIQEIKSLLLSIAKNDL